MLIPLVMVGPPTPEAIQAAAHVASNAAGPYWWAQPVATLIAAAAAYYGIKNAMRIHKESVAAQERRMVCDQLEKRAKERERLLQDAYTDYFDACLRLVEIYDRIITLRHFIGQEDDKELVARWEKDRDLAEDDVVRFLAALGRVLTRLTLIDDNLSRRTTATNLADRARNRPPMYDYPHKEEIEDMLKTFSGAVSLQLDREYRKASELARAGTTPKRKVKVHLSASTSQSSAAEQADPLNPPTPIMPDESRSG